MTNIKIIKTEDGSHSLYREDLNETYHSFHGAIQESSHVFIKMGLEHYQESSGPMLIKIFEVGFGTGLNALLALKYAEEHKTPIYFESVETIPVQEEVYKDLNYSDQIGYTSEFSQMHACEWGSEVSISEYFTLKKVQEPLETYESSQNFNVLFFDAFAPSKQPELWDIALMHKSFDLLDQDGVFVTYCAKGQLKRDLATAGFEVQTLPGAPGKKEMVRGIKKS